MTNSQSVSPWLSAAATFRESADVEIAVEAGLKTLAELLNFDRASVALIDPDHFRVVYEFNNEQHHSAKGNSISSSESALMIMTGNIFSGISKFDNSASSVSQNQPFFNLYGVEFASNLVLFLKGRGMIVGFLTLQSKAVKQFSGKEEDLVVETADMMSMLLFLARENIGLKRALIDAQQVSSVSSRQADLLSLITNCPDCSKLMD